jgi:quercetin dioxygenase-like cupin family protein
MTKLNRTPGVAVVIGIAATGLIATPTIASPLSGVTITNFVTADLDAGDHFNSDRIKFQTKGPTDVRMQKLEFAAGGTTGWHHHPGMVIVEVASGTIELWDTSCGKTAYGPGSPNGQVFIEALPHAHQATSTGGATVYVTYVVPSASPPVFRVEEQVPFCAQPAP